MQLWTWQSTYDHIEWSSTAIEVDGKQIALSDVCERLNEGDEIIAFITDAKTNPTAYNDPELSEGIDEPLYDYDMICPSQSLFKKQADGTYSAFNFIALFGSEEQYTTQKALEKRIKENVDKMLKKPYKEVLFGSFNGTDET